MRTLLALAVLGSFAIASSAATLGVSPDKTTYLVGETITLSINGDAQGASTCCIYGRLEFNGSLVDNGTRSQKLIGPGGDWIKGLLNATDTNANSATSATAEAFNQVNVSYSGFQTATNPISTITLIAQSVGIVNVIWNTTTGSGFELGYFGLTSAPGTSFTIVPEPATAALLGIGLLGVALSMRRGSAG
jgi:hypothetical protein